MHPVATRAEHALLRSAHPALKLSELLDQISEGLDRTLDARRLRAILEAHPERFRILEPWRGRWLSSAGPSTSLDLSEPWIVAIGEPEPPPDGAAPAALKLRESVRWLARDIDPRSGTDVSRWDAIATSERAIRSTLTRRAA